MTAGSDDELPRLLRLVPLIWIALSLAWAIVIVVTDRPAWALALWVAANLGPLAALDRAGSR